MSSDNVSSAYLSLDPTQIEVIHMDNEMNIIIG